MVYGIVMFHRWRGVLGRGPANKRGRNSSATPSGCCLWQWDSQPPSVSQVAYRSPDGVWRSAVCTGIYTGYVCVSSDLPNNITIHYFL